MTRAERMRDEDLEFLRKQNERLAGRVNELERDANRHAYDVCKAIDAKHSLEKEIAEASKRIRFLENRSYEDEKKIERLEGALNKYAIHLDCAEKCECGLTEALSPSEEASHD